MLENMLEGKAEMKTVVGDLLTSIGAPGQGVGGEGDDPLQPHAPLAADSSVIDLTSHGLDELPRAIGYFTNIETLILSRNRLFNSTRLFAAIEANKKLRHIDLASNHLNGALSPTVGDLPLLETLILDRNHLSELPLELGRCTNLVVFSARLNQIKVRRVRRI